ncbi:zf-HC2 domain-containing protein [Herbaspirillum sp. SJZ107]|uniref:zf-HC2 domain-containing protein n=1 Tax=Herbaspirillum sp. SJZ107 TaxID=2572881 RepID=UPI001151B344|nr:zf-HC2 domain-containing protein [Herbaspirillum sp. SJZ107]TQK10982.1 putative zinc finger protein [Herbaspirillum sp. SJZ107]
MNPHREAQEALPWLANGSLAGSELERVQAHLKGCAACRADLAALHTLRAAGAGTVPDCDPDAALARLLPQLDALPPQQPAAPIPVPAQASTLPGWRTRLAANDGRWLRLAVGAQCCVIAVLAGLLVRPSGGAEARAGDYRVLGAAAGSQSRLIVMFKPDTPERELRRIVLENGARIAGGPTATGAWVLATEQPADAVAGRLRGQAAVTLAEPLGAEGSP